MTSKSKSNSKKKEHSKSKTNSKKSNSKKISTKSSNKKSSVKSIKESSKKSIKKSTKYTLDKKIPYGIYDPNGFNINPLTKKPYQNLYQHISKNIKGEVVPATYSNLAKIWTSIPVHSYKDDVLQCIKGNQITLAKAGTGAGKTVLIPKIALHALDYKESVICTIPKKIITESTASFAAMCLDVKIGEEVGFFFRGKNMTHKNGKTSKLIFSTTGSLISRMTGSDPLLKDYKCIVIDEAHERSVQTDQLLLLLKKATMVRKDLKVVIMSATINLETFRNYFPKPQFSFGEVDVGAELTYPITDYWIDKKPKDWRKTAVERIINILMTSTFGDILVFGKSGGDASVICSSLTQELKKVKKSLSVKSHIKSIYYEDIDKYTISTSSKKTKSHPKTEINPFCTKLASGITDRETELATDKMAYLSITDASGQPYTRKVVVSTNVAESSLTVDGVVFVIDSGYEFLESYYPREMMRSLVEEEIPQSSSMQRRGRCGRVEPGQCYHLYSESDFKNMQKYPTPDIQKSDLTSDILDLLRLDYIKNIADLKKLLNEFISPPEGKFINTALKTLQAIGAITSISDEGEMTAIGYAISKFRAVKPTYARSIIASYYYRCHKSVIDMICMAILADGKMDKFIVQFNEKDYLKKSPKILREAKVEYQKIRESFTSPYGDLFTLLNAYQAFREYKEENKPHQVNKKENNQDQELQGGKATTNKSKSKVSNVPEAIAALNVKEEQKLINSIKSSEKIEEKGIEEPMETADLQELVEQDIEYELKSGADFKAERSVKRWCRDHYLNYNSFRRVKIMAKLIERTLRDIVAPRKKEGKFFKPAKLEKEVYRFDSQEDNILMSLLIGNHTNIARYCGNKKYISTFPSVKVFTKASMESFISGNPTLVMYDELFMFSKGAPPKMNLVTAIPNHILSVCSKLFKNTVPMAFQKTLPEKYVQATQKKKVIVEKPIRKNLINKISIINIVKKKRKVIKMIGYKKKECLV